MATLVCPQCRAVYREDPRFPHVCRKGRRR